MRSLCKLKTHCSKVKLNPKEKPQSGALVRSWGGGGTFVWTIIISPQGQECARVRHTLIQLTQINELRHQDPGTLKDTARERRSHRKCWCWIFPNYGHWCLPPLSSVWIGEFNLCWATPVMVHWPTGCRCVTLLLRCKSSSTFFFELSNKTPLKKTHGTNNQLTRVNETSWSLFNNKGLIAEIAVTD